MIETGTVSTRSFPSRRSQISKKVTLGTTASSEASSDEVLHVREPVQHRTRSKGTICQSQTPRRATNGGQHVSSLATQRLNLCPTGGYLGGRGPWRTRRSLNGITTAVE
ncbi:hypothetical protein CaCOL14_006001 [Colletotrichum acutatum]